MHFDCGSSIQSYASLVFLGMHASRSVQSGKRCQNLLLGKLSCDPGNTLSELYGVKVWEGLRETHGAVTHISQKMIMCFIFSVPSWLYTILHSVLWRVLQNLKCL